MTTFILVHGSWHGAWCWERLVPRPQAAGHNVIAVDLPGYGEDRRPIGDITLQAYADKVLAALDAAAEPVVLVGWSMDGIVVSTVAEQRPERIAHLVHIAAFMLPHGVSALEFFETTREFHETPSKISQYRVVDPGEGIHWIVPDGVRDLFLNDANDADVAWVSKRLQPDYLAPLGTPVQVSAERFRVPTSKRCTTRIFPLPRSAASIPRADTPTAGTTTEIPTRQTAPRDTSVH